MKLSFVSLPSRRDSLIASSAAGTAAEQNRFDQRHGHRSRHGQGRAERRSSLSRATTSPASAIKPRRSRPRTRRVIDCKGKFILPGYIDTHVHFFQSGDIFTRPDAVDLTSVRPYEDELAWIEHNLRDTFARYLRCGITSVVDVGGPMWNFEVRKLANSTAKAPRVAVAGPLISSVSRPQLDLNGDPPIVKIDTPEQGREMVGKLGAQKPDYVKIWYIVNAENPVEKFRPIVHAVIEESHRAEIARRRACHRARGRARRRSRKAPIFSSTASPTNWSTSLRQASEGKGHDPHADACRLRALRPHLREQARSHAGRESVGQSGSDRIARRHQTPGRQGARSHQERAGESRAVLDRIQKTYDIALKNLKTLQDAGVTIAAGTDAGNIGTIHGPAHFP